MARTKNQEGTCSTPVKGQVNHSHLDKNQGTQQCDVEGQLNSNTPIKRGNVPVSTPKFGKRSRSSSPRQQDLSPRRSPRTVAPQELLCQTELSILDSSLHQATDHLLQKTTPSPKGRWKKRSPGDTGESDVSKTCSTQEGLTDFPKTASPSLNFDSLSERKSADGAVQDEGRIFVYQNLKHAISGLPGGTRTPEGTSTPIVYIRDVLQREEEPRAAGSGTISGSELRKHLLKSFITASDMANEEPGLVGNKKKVSPKKGPVQIPAKNENHELAKNLVEKPSKTKSVAKSLLIKDNSEKKENVKRNVMLLKEYPSQSPSNGAKLTPNSESREKVIMKSKKKRRLPSSTMPMEVKNVSDALATDTKLPGDSGSVEITLNNGDQLLMDTAAEDMSSSLPLSTSPTPPKDGDVRHGRRIRSPSVRYADDMILFPLKSPRKSPKFGNARDVGSPDDRQDKTSETEKPFRTAEGEKLTKTAECQTSELYALLTRTLSNDKIITPSRRKSPVETAVASENSASAKKHTGAVREINFSEGVKNNTRDSQIQVQMEEHLATVRKEELTRLRQESSVDTDNTSQSTSTVTKKDNTSKSDSRPSADMIFDSKQKSANKKVNKQSSSKVSDSKQKIPVKKESKQTVSKQNDSKQRSLLKSDKKQSILKPTDSQQSVSKPTVSKQCVSKQSVPKQSDSKQIGTKCKQSNKSECEKTDSKQVDSKHRDSDCKRKSPNKSVPKENVSKQSESRQFDSKQSDSKQNGSKSANKSVVKEFEVDSKEGCSSKKESKKIGDKIDAKHKSKTKNYSKQMDASNSDLKQSDHVKDNPKHMINISSESERTTDCKADLKQNRTIKSDTEKLQCDNLEPDSKRSRKMAVKTDLKRTSGVKCEPQQSGSPEKKDLSGKSKTNPDEAKRKRDLHGARDVKCESDIPTDKFKGGKSQNEETDVTETCERDLAIGGDKNDSMLKSDILVSQKPKSSNLFSLISRVKSNLECPNPLTEFLNSPLYDPATSGDEEEEISDESFAALDNKDNKQVLEESDHSFDKDNNISSNKLVTEIPDNEAGIETGSPTTKDKCNEKQPQWRKSDQDKNSLEDLLGSGGQDEEQKSQDRVSRSLQDKNQSPCRVTRAQTSPEKHQSQTKSPRRHKSPDKNAIYPADVILVNSATSSSDNVNSVSSGGQKPDGKMDDNQSTTVTTTDADSTTDDSPARKNIFDLLMGSYKPGEKEGENEEGKEEQVEKVVKQDTNDSVKEKLTPNTSSESDPPDSKKESDSDRTQRDLQASDSVKKDSKACLPDPVDTVDLTCDEDGFDVTVEVPTELASPLSGLAGSAIKIDLTGSLTASAVQRGQTGLVSHDTPDHPKISEPKPLDILKSVEMDTPDKMSAFQSKSLDDYLQKMKYQDAHVEQDDDDEGEEEDEDEEEGEDEEEEDEENEDEENQEEDEEDEEEENEDEQREFEEELEPDFDEVDGMVFVSFPSEETLSAHIEVERKTRIGKNENLLLGISRLRNLRKKRDQMQLKYNKRIHKLKALKAQGQLNQNLRGMHKALEKYQKLYRTELYMILKSKNKDINFKSPQKTSDITKIKGWKKKFGNTEQLAEATGLPISQAGKLHWRTEARLLKNLKPDELKEIGLNLKKKRRKNLVFTIRKGMSKGDNRSDRNEDGTEEYEDAEGEGYDEDNDNEGNEDEFRDDDVSRDDSWFEDLNISAEKEKKSQYVKKQERLRKRLMLQSLSFGPEEETIIRKLGGQRSLRKSILGLTAEDRAPVLEEVIKGKRGRKRKGEAMTLTTVSQTMAIQALAALDRRFVKDQPKPPPLPKAAPPVKEEGSDRLGLQEDGNIDEDWLPPVVVTKEKRIRGRRKKRKFNQKVKEENAVQCDQPGCRYGCICHLCKFAESAPDSESRPSQDTPCDKEYCRLGCICDSIGARGHDPMGECQKPECQQGCVCVKEEQGEVTEEEKRQRQKATQKRVEVLPRRQSTYRLAKNLDAVSRKAMQYYESSEMYCTEQTTRKRKSKETDDLPSGQHKTVCHSTGPGPASHPVPHATKVSGNSQSHGPAQPAIQRVPPPTVATDSKMSRYVITAGHIKSSNGTPENKNSKSASKPSKPTGRIDPPWYPTLKSRKKEETSVRRTEFDDITFDEMLESDNEDSGDSCARTVAYNSVHSRNKQRCTCHADHCTQGTASCHGAKATYSGTQKPKTAEVGDSLSPIVISPGNTPPSSPSAPNLTRLSDRIGCNGSKNIPPMGARKSIHTGWHTQWVCLKTSKKKSEEEEESYEIRLLEMISNCNWENAKQKILSKISNQISREHYPNPRQMIVGDFCISFLPRSDKPAVIPPEVKAKLPKSIFSIRIKVEKRGHVLKARLGEFITAQEKILKPSLESPEVIPVDTSPTTTSPNVVSGGISTISSVVSGGIGTISSVVSGGITTSSNVVSGGISGLSHLQINRHTTPSVLKWKPMSNTEGKTVTSPSQVSPLTVSSPSSILLKPGMCTKVVAPPHGTAGKGQPNNLVILQNTVGQKYVLASPVSQPNLQFVPPASSSIISSAVSQNITRGTDSAVSTSTSSATVVSSSGPFMISNVITTTNSAPLPTSSGNSGGPIMISCTNPSNIPVNSIPLINSGQVAAKFGVIPSINPNVSRAISPGSSGVALFATKVPQANSSKTGSTSTSVSCPNVINMTFTLPGKSTSHSTVTTHSVPVTLLASTQAVTMVTMATSANATSAIKGTLSSLPGGSLLTQQSGGVLQPCVKVQRKIGDLAHASTGPGGILSKLVPIVPKPQQEMILIPIPAPTCSRYNVPIVPSNPSKMTTAKPLQTVQEMLNPSQILNPSKKGPGKKEANPPVVVIKEMRFGPSDNKQLVTKNTVEQGDVMYHKFVMSRPQVSPVGEVEAKQGKKRKKDTKDDDNNQEDNYQEMALEKKKKKKKKKKPKPSEGDEGETKSQDLEEGKPKSQEEGKKVSKKRKKKKVTSEKCSDSLTQGEKADKADGSSPPSKKCRKDSAELTEEQSMTLDSETGKMVSDAECGNGSEDVKTNTKLGETNSNMVTKPKDTSSDSKCDKDTKSDSNCDKNSPIEMKCIKDTVPSSDGLEIAGTKCDKDTDSTRNEKQTVTPDLHSVLFSQIENSIREYDGRDEPDIPNTSHSTSPAGQCDSLSVGKPNIPTTAEPHNSGATEHKASIPTTVKPDNSGVMKDKASIPTTAEPDNSGVTEDKASIPITAQPDNLGVTEDKSGIPTTAKPDNLGVMKDKASIPNTVKPENSGVLKDKASIPTTAQPDNLGATKDKASIPNTVKPENSGAMKDTPSIPTTVKPNTIRLADNKPDDLSFEFSEKKSSDILPMENLNISDEIDGQPTVSSMEDLTNPSVSVVPHASDLDVPLALDSPSLFEMDTESSEGDRQSCETSQNSLNDLKMLATVQKASLDVLQIIEGSKNPPGAKHPLLVVSSGEEIPITNTDSQSSQGRVTISGIDNQSTQSRVSTSGIDNQATHSKVSILGNDNGTVEKLVGKSMEIVNSIRHHIDLSQDKIRETKLQTGEPCVQEENTHEKPQEDDGTWDSRMGHEGCDDLVISLSDDESNSPETENPVCDGIASAAKGESGHLKPGVVRAETESVAVIIIDDEDKPSDALDKQQVTAPSNVRSNSVTPPAIDEVDITTVSDKENDDSDIDIENASDDESGSNQLQSYLSQTVQPPPTCFIHSHKGKRKASLDTIDNMLKHSVEFKEGLVKSSKSVGGKPMERNTKHNSMEKQRRRELKNGFKDLIEVLFGQDETGQKKPLSVEAIQGASKIKVLHMALNMIKESEVLDTQCISKMATLRVQNSTLNHRLSQSRRDLIQSGMAPVKITDILNKISKTCQFIFAKREMLMKKRLDTLKTAMDTCATSDTKAANLELSDPKTIARSKKTNPKSNPKTKANQPKQAQLKGRSVTPILPKVVPYTAVPVQLVSTAQVLQMAQLNQRAQPEIYIDNPEDQDTPIKEERLSDDEYSQDMPLQVANSWSQPDGRGGVSVNDNNAKLRVDSSSASNHGKVDEEELDRMNTQSPVFSDVDISENYFVQQDEEDDNMEVGADDPLTSSHTSSDMEYKVIDTSSHSEVMVGYMPEERGEPSQDEDRVQEDLGQKDDKALPVGVS